MGLFNPFTLKKYVALILPSFLTVISFYVGVSYYGLLWWIAFMLGGLLIGVLIGQLFLSNPFSALLEGKGILVFNFDSTGVIRPFIVAVASPFIKGKFQNQPISDVFDRDAVYNLAIPEKNGTATTDQGGVTIKLDEMQYNKARMALFHYPVLLWNNQIKSVITKDFISEQEKSTFAEHGVLYLNRKMEELTSAMRDFGRHVVELTKPKTDIFKSKLFWIVVVIGLIILFALFAPKIIQAITGAVGGASNSIGGITGGGTITPRG